MIKRICLCIIILIDFVTVINGKTLIQHTDEFPNEQIKTVYVKLLCNAYSDETTINYLDNSTKTKCSYMQGDFVMILGWDGDNKYLVKGRNCISTIGNGCMAVSKELYDYQSTISELRKQKDSIQMVEKKRIDSIETDRIKNEDAIKLLKLKSNYPNLYIDKIEMINLNSADGVSIAFNIENTSNFTIKYIDLKAQLFNQVGDTIMCSIKHTSVALLKITGPIYPIKTLLKEPSSYSFENVWYNSTAYCIKLLSIKITITKGNIIIFTGKKLNTLFDNSINNDCSFVDQNQ